MRYGRRYKINKKRNLQKSWRSISRQDKSDLTRLLSILGAIVVVSAFAYYIGINGLTHIGGFWAAFTGERGEVSGDTNPPPPPIFEPVSPYTKSPSITLKGFAEPGAEVTIFVNDAESGKSSAEAGGTFTMAGIALKEGKNVITAVAADPSGNQSQKSAELGVTLDTKKPELTISSPKPEAKVSSKDAQIKVTGKAETGATVRVNSIQAQIQADGTFKAVLTNIQPGPVTITITATDKAGNEEKVELKVTFEKTE